MPKFKNKVAAVLLSGKDPETVKEIMTWAMYIAMWATIAKPSTKVEVKDGR